MTVGFPTRSSGGGFQELLQVLTMDAYVFPGDVVNSQDHRSGFYVGSLRMNIGILESVASQPHHVSE